VVEIHGAQATLASGWEASAPHQPVARGLGFAPLPLPHGQSCWSAGPWVQSQIS